MAKNLVIVESPAKAKTIEGFLGKDFTVKPSFGHVRDLVKKGLGVEVDNNFRPTYEVSDDKKNVIAELKKLSKSADTVWLASDEDREGEAISWHLFETLGLQRDKTRRIVFHEITKPAIQKAIENPREIDLHLVDAQQARRILDRLVGFELSPVLWKKVKPSLSAGRVQSVAVRLIVEREREVVDFQSTSAYRVTAIFQTGKGQSIKAELPKRFSTEEEAHAFLSDCLGAQFTVKSLEVKPAKKTPSAPFTTSTLQQEASRKLGFSVSQTMAVAQRLYESGKITYMRTDSTNLSELAMGAAGNEIVRMFGADYHQSRQFRTKSKGAQEAHEAIRPTYMDRQQVEGDAQERRLYELIWKRTIASQMSDAQIERTIIHIQLSNNKEFFVAKGEVLKFEGFLKVYMESVDDEEQEEGTSLLPKVTEGEALNLLEADATERFALPPPRYSEASLVKKLEELGIGRPSTYAPTISTIQNRGYVVKEDREGRSRTFGRLLLREGKIKSEQGKENTGAERSKLFPTDIGMVVNDFLVKAFDRILDYNFTATVEKEFDEIAEGKVSWQSMMQRFYTSFHPQVEKTMEESERATGERVLGEEPGTGRKVFARIGRYGPLIQIGDSEAEDKPRFSSLKANQRLETITLAEALELFKLPRVVGAYEGHEMVVAAGRFGPYVRHNGAFVSLKKEDDPLTINQDRAIELIEEKRKIERERVIKTFVERPDVQVLNGRWGPYLVVDGHNYKLPKDVVPGDLDLEGCLSIAKEGTGTPIRKAASRKAGGSASSGSKAKAAPKKSVSSGATKKKAPATAKSSKASSSSTKSKASRTKKG